MIEYSYWQYGQSIRERIRRQSSSDLLISEKLSDGTTKPLIDKMARWAEGVPEVAERWDWEKEEEAMVICEEGLLEGVTNRELVELVICLPFTSEQTISEI